jgi:capsular exopolysaccharide synthesis family protein
MSRVDQAWTRASASRTLLRDVAARADRLEEEQPDDIGLHQYPQERGPFSFQAQAPNRLPHRTTAAPQTRERSQRGSVRPGFEPTLVVSDRTTPLAVLEYRRLADALHRLQLERGLKTLIVTSALPNEGKTTTVANLALTLSGFFARRVLLIDGDLRRPSIHTAFRLPNACGLSDVLLSERADIPLLEVSATLNVLPAGADHNTIAALTSDRMEDLVEQLASQFDWVLVDAPAVEFMPEAHLLASLAGAVLFVIGARSTPYPVVDRAVAALGPDRIVGVVLNRVVSHNIPRLANELLTGSFPRTD